MKQSPAFFTYIVIALAILSQLALAQENNPEDDSTAKTLAESGYPEIYEGLVFGIGKGTLAVIIFSLVGVFLCLFKDCSSTPNCVVCIGISLPIIVLIIVRSLPFKQIGENKKEPSGSYTGTALAFTVIILLSCLILCFFLICTNLTAELVSSKIDSQSLQINKYDRAEETINQVKQLAQEEAAENASQNNALATHNNLIEDDSRPLINNRDAGADPLATQNSPSPVRGQRNHDVENQFNMRLQPMEVDRNRGFED